MKIQRYSWCGEAWEQFCKHAREHYPFPFWDNHGIRWIMCSSCGLFAPADRFVCYGGEGLAAYMGICRSCAPR